jgi:hypothetical protein
MRYLDLPKNFQPERGWSYSGLFALVDCAAYTRHGGDPDVRWCRFERLSIGDAAVYPVKVRVPGRGIGQFKFEEVRRWRYERSVLEALEELARAHRATGFNGTTPIPPGIDPDWLAAAL